MDGSGRDLSSIPGGAAVGTAAGGSAAVGVYTGVIAGSEATEASSAMVAGLTFQLAADIIERSITTEWQAVAFLERDLTEVRERQCEAAALAGRSGDEPIDGQTPPTSSPPSAPP
jgi:hypothetical protein